MSTKLAAPGADTIEGMLANAVAYQDPRVVDLGVTKVLIRTNVPSFPGFRYFSRVGTAQIMDNSAPYELYCIDLNHPHSLNAEAVREHADRSFRAKRFRAGFYLTYHFGPPASLITRGSRHYIVGHNLDRIVWGWYVKYILTAHSLLTRSLHLKAACFARDGRGTLLIGRGNGGKTVMLTQMCQEGAAFVSNTHVIVDGNGVAHGVPTTLRVREDPCFGSLIGSGQLRAHLDENEFIADPSTLFPLSKSEVNVDNICVVDYRVDRNSRIEFLEPAAAYDLFEQFGFPINTYGMKDDVLHFYDGDFERFVDGYADLKKRLRNLVDKASCFYVAGCDMMNKKYRSDLNHVLDH